jgi:hypothetical protein
MSLVESLPQLYLVSLTTILILSSHIRLKFPRSLFPRGFPNKNVCNFYLPIHATCLTHLIVLHLLTLSILEEMQHFKTSVTYSPSHSVLTQLQSTMVYPKVSGLSHN